MDATGTAWVAGNTFSYLDGNKNAGESDLFLMAFNAEGTHLWTHQRGGAGDDYARALQVGPEGGRACRGPRAASHRFHCGHLLGVLDLDDIRGPD